MQNEASIVVLMQVFDSTMNERASIRRAQFFFFFFSFSIFFANHKQIIHDIITNIPETKYGNILNWNDVTRKKSELRG